MLRFQTLLAGSLLIAAFVLPLQGAGLGATNENLVSSAVMRSWETPVPIIPGHEPGKANDASMRSYWQLNAESVPADLGAEWKTPQTISSVVVRYFDGRMVRGPWVARTQEMARLQYWKDGKWVTIQTQSIGQETTVVRYVFASITTTRIRLLFSEPANPQLRYAGPGQVGIYVCEFEAYRDAPFKTVECPGCLQKTRRPVPHYNEEPASDSPVDLAGPLIVEPKQTRVFSDVLRPNLIVANSDWAKMPATAQVSREGKVAIRNGFLGLEISTRGVVRETSIENYVSGDTLPLDQSRLFSIKTTERKILTEEDFSLLGVDVSQSTPDTARISIHLVPRESAEARANVSVNYELRAQDHFLHKWLTIENSGKTALQAQDILVSSLSLPHQRDLMAGNELTYPVSIVSAKGGFFECLETVYWDHDGDALTYYPGVEIAAGQQYASEKAVVGAYQAMGDYVAGWDRGIREWIVEYHAHISPVPPAWPDIYLEGWSAQVGITEMRSDPQWTERFLKTASQLGVRYMDTREDTFRVLHYPEAWRRQWVDLATKYDIGTGFWIDFGDLDDDNGPGKAIAPIPCKLSERGETYYRQVTDLVATMKLRGLHWADFFTAWPCAAESPKDPVGRYSIYAQGQRMIRFSQEMHQGSPGLMLGADGGLTSPQFGRYADDRQHGGGEDASPAIEQDIHLDRLYSAMNREYLNAAHMTYLRPWYRLLNCVNHFGQETHHHDSAGFRYALLSAFALSGQLTFNDAPVDMPAADIAFAQQWEDWVRKRKEYFLHSDRLFDRSVGWYEIQLGDGDGLQGFAHIRNDEGYIFLSNPSPVPQTAELTLALGEKRSKRYAVDQVFPSRASLSLPLPTSLRNGGILHASVPGKQVVVLHIGPSAHGEAPSTGAAPSQSAAVRYIGQWSSQRLPGTMNAQLSSTFSYPLSGDAYLRSTTPELQWSAEPWAYEKAYLVLYTKSEKETLENNWIQTTLPITVTINGVRKTAHPFLTKRTQNPGVARCFFVSLDSEVNPGAINQVEVELPILQGLVFAGAYLDLPDQTPTDLPEESFAAVSAAWSEHGVNRR